MGLYCSLQQHSVLFLLAICMFCNTIEVTLPSTLNHFQVRRLPLKVQSVSLNTWWVWHICQFFGKEILTYSGTALKRTPLRSPLSVRNSHNSGFQCTSVGVALHTWAAEDAYSDLSFAVRWQKRLVQGSTVLIYCLVVESSGGSTQLVDECSHYRVNFVQFGYRWVGEPVCFL